MLLARDRMLRALSVRLSIHIGTKLAYDTMSAKALGKRKRGNGKGAASLDQLGDDDTDNIKEKYGNQTLPVAILPADFSGDPADGAQYLAVVR